MIYDEFAQQYIKMKNLKSALGKDEQTDKIQSSSISNSIKSKKSDSSSSIWSIVADLEDEEKYSSIDSAKFTTQILQTLSQYNKMGKPVQQDTLNQLILSQQHNLAPYSQEKDVLLVLQRKMTHALQNPPIELQNYINRFLDLIKARKWKLKSKDVATRKKVMEFDEIADKMFKKTTQVKKQPKKRYLQINLQKQPNPKKKSAAKGSNNHDSNGTKNSGDSQDSAQGRLGKLLVGDKYQKKAGKEKHQNTQEQENYSFSSVMSASVAVKQRNSKNSKTDKKMDLTNAQQNQKVKEKDSKPTDEAFIFYRPKKVKK